MKPLLLLLLLCAALDAPAQEFSLKPKGKMSEITVVIQNLFSDIEITGTSGGEFYVETDDYKGPPDKAAGLRALSATGPDNSGIGLNINQSGDTVIISGAGRNRNGADYRISLPATVKLRIDYGSFKSDDITIRGMANEVEVKSQVGDVTLIDVTGPIVANTLSADIEIAFTTLSQASPSAIASISGDIDITLPASSQGNFSLSSISGEIYTDLDFDLAQDNGVRRFPGGINASTSLNGGGVEFTIRSISGDIYLRKAK